MLPSLCIHILHCISFRNDDGSTDQLKDAWESEDVVMVFSPEDDAMVFYSDDGGWSEDADTNFLVYILPRQALVHNPYFSAL